jgi:hypothetical protein
MEKGTKIINWEKDYLYILKQYQQLKIDEFVSDRMSYIVLRGCWCNIVLNVHAQIEEKRDDSKEFL